MADPPDYSHVVKVFSANSLITHHSDFKFPFETQSTSINLVGACNGLMCIMDYDPNYRDRHIYLINPFIHKYKRLDVGSSCYADDLMGKTWETDDDIIMVRVGFGYSVVENDYKVLRIITHHATDCVSTSKVEIYSLNSGKWKGIDFSIANEMTQHFPPVFVHECFYWYGYCDDCGEDCANYLLCFNLKDELFSKIELPKTHQHQFYAWCFNVLVKNGSLAIVLYPGQAETASPSMRICVLVLVLDKNCGGQVEWKEFNYECASFNTSHYCFGFGSMGLNGGERLLFVTRETNSNSLTTEYIVAVDLDNSCAIETLALDLTEDVLILETINVFESLVLFSD